MERRSQSALDPRTGAHGTANALARSLGHHKSDGNDGNTDRGVTEPHRSQHCATDRVLLVNLPPRIDSGGDRARIEQERYADTELVSFT